MEWTADARFTDQHVRMQPGLLALATQYAKEYQGEFDPLVKAHVWAIENGTLSIPTARMVLNCMRHDLNVAATLPDPYGLGGIAPPAKRAHLVAVPEYRPPVPLNTEFKYGYLVSTKPLFPSHPVRICHILNHSRSGVQVDNGRVVVRLKAWCGWQVDNRRDELAAQTVPSQPEGSRACRSCDKLLLKAGME